MFQRNLSTDFSNSILKVESGTPGDNTSWDSLVFYTPEGSSNTSETFKYSPSPEKDIISSIFNFQQDDQMVGPLISRKLTDFICNLNPPNSNFIIGASATQNGRVSLLPIPHNPKPVNVLSTNKLAKKKVRSKSLNTNSIQKDSVLHRITNVTLPTNSASSSRKFCQSSYTRSQKHKTNDIIYKHHTRLSLRNKIYKEVPKRKFKCNQCANIYTLEYWYLIHLQKHKENSLFQCDSCDLSFSSRNALKYHKPSHYSDHMLRRSKRNSLLTSSSNENVPLKLTLDEINLPNISNSLRVSYKIQFDSTETTENFFPITLTRSNDNVLNSDPVSSNTNAHKYIVTSVNRKNGLHSKSLLLDTLPSSNQDSNSIGSDSLPLNKTVSNLIEENFTHSKINCSFCPRSFGSERALKIHCFSHKRHSREKCNVSPPNYPTKNSFFETCPSSLSSQNEIDSTEENSELIIDFKCNICEKTFTSQRALNIHCFSHKKKLIVTKTRQTNLNLRNLSKKLSPCKLCEHDTSEFVQHPKTRFPIKTVKSIPTCTDGVDDSNTKLIDRYPYICPYCSQAFRFLKSYLRHLPSHNGNIPDIPTNDEIIASTRPFKCSQCIGRFISNSALKSHGMIHMGDKPFSCEFCPRTFATKSHVKTHTRIHTGEKPFRCYQCGMRYSHKCSLKTHFNKLHPSSTYT